jgi:ectoine hydroxylase-related dioxygenase (phytanoyl-CoA dioxygenase family)
VSLITHPLLVGWSERALLPSCGSIQLAGSQAMVVGPGEAAQYLHRDQSAWAWFNQLLPGGPEVVTVCMVAVTDFTEGNGATRVVPGSHRLADDERLYDPAAGVAAEMSAGSVLLFSGKTVHGAGANRTADKWRFGINLAYALGWLRSEEAHPFAIEPDVARSLPPRARQLLGFTQYDPPVGDGGRLWLVDFEDPAPLFTPDSRNDSFRPTPSGETPDPHLGTHAFGARQ